MTITKRALAATALLAVAAVTAHYLPGQLAAHFLHSGIAQFNMQGLLYMAADPIQHDWTESRVTTRVRLVPPASSPAHHASDQADPQLVLLHRIHHIPYLSLDEAGYVIETSFDPSAPQQPDWVSQSGFAEALLARTLLHFNGSSTTDVRLQGATRTLPDGTELNWSGFNARLHFDATFTHLQASGGMGAIQLTVENSGIHTAPSSFTAEMHRNQTGRWFGKQQLQAGPITVHSHTTHGESHTFSVQALQLDTHSEQQETGIFAALRVDLTDTVIDDTDIPRLLLDLAAADVPPEPLYALQQLGRQVQADPGSAIDGPQPVQALILEQLRRLLQGDPRLQIKPLRMETTQGDFNLDLDLRIQDGDRIAVLGPAALLQALTVDISVSAHLRLLQAMLTEQNRIRLQQQVRASHAQPPSGEALLQQAQALAEQQVNGWIQLGFLVPHQDTGTSHIQLDRGLLRLNGVDMGPVKAAGTSP